MAARPVSETLKEYARGVAGGLLFAIAPLYTMEIWRQGNIVSPGLMLTGTLLMFAVLVAYAYYAGLHEDKSFFNNVLEAAETVAIGAVLSIVILRLAGQLPGELGFYEAFGRIVTETTSVSIGVAVGASQLGEASGDDDEQKAGTAWHEIALSVLGAMLIAVGLAPTEEIVMIAVSASPEAVLITAVLSFGLTLGMVHYTKFRGSGRFEESIFAGGPLGDAVVTYALALVVALALRWIGGGLDDFGLLVIVNQIVFLGVATALGASAGRLLLS